MKKIILSLLIMFFVNKCDSVEPVNPTWKKNFTITQANDNGISDSLKQLFILDAERLSVSDIVNSASKNSLIEIPEELFDSYYNALVYIYKFSLESDHYKNLQFVHTFPYPETREFRMELDTTESWTKQWLLGIQKTGYKKLDELISNYKIKLKFVSNYKSTAKLISENGYNLYALKKKFIGLKGIKNVDLVNWQGDGSDIDSKMFPDRIKFVYNLRWGDCPAGCIYKHVWNVQVDKSGNVKIINEYGDEIPENVDRY